MTVASGIGSMPGDGAADYDEAVRVVLEETPDLPYLPELPARGAAANMVGRALALVSGLGADLQPAGWRLTDAPGVDHRRARSLLSQDLDVFEERAQGFTGRVKVQVAGPWTLAATVERPRGDRVLADHGARRELAQALAEGLRGHIADVRRRVPGAEVVVQVDEPALPAVLAARVPTASGFGRHRSVDAPVASAALEWVFEAITAAGAVPVAHCCAPDPPLSLLIGAGARGVSVDLSVLDLGAYDDLADALEKERLVFLGVVPTTEACPSGPDPGGPDGSGDRSSGSGDGRSGSGDGRSGSGDRNLTDRVLRALDMLGSDPAASGDLLVITPTCGLARATPAWSRRAHSLSRQVAANLASG